MGKVVVGVDPHKASNTVVVIDGCERVLVQQRFANDRGGYREMKAFVRDYRDRVWAVEGARGVGAGLAQRPVAEGEQVLNVPRSSPPASERSVAAVDVRPTTRTHSRLRLLDYEPATCSQFGLTTRLRSWAC